MNEFSYYIDKKNCICYGENWGKIEKWLISVTKIARAGMSSIHSKEPFSANVSNIQHPLICV